MYIGLPVKWPPSLSDINEIWIFSKDFPKYTQMSDCVKILSVGDELFHVSGQTDKYEANNLFFFFSFANMPKTIHIIVQIKST